MIGARAGEPTQDGRLLVRLLGHEVRMARAVAGAGLAFELGDLGVELTPGGHVEEPVTLGRHERGLSVLDEGHPARALENRALVGGQQVPSVAPAQHQRRAVLRRGELALLPIEHRDGVQPAQLAERGHGGADELLGPGRRVGQALLEEVRHHLGIGLGTEVMAGPRQPLPELAVVRDNSIVDQREASAAVEVRVRIGHRDPTVGRPARMPDTHAAARQPGNRVADLADALVDRHGVVVSDRDTPRVVAPILEPPQASQHDRRRVPVPAHVAEDPAHRRHPPRKRRREAIRRHRGHPAHGSRARAGAARRLPPGRAKTPRASRVTTATQREEG